MGLHALARGWATERCSDEYSRQAREILNTAILNERVNGELGNTEASWQGVAGAITAVPACDSDERNLGVALTFRYCPALPFFVPGCCAIFRCFAIRGSALCVVFFRPAFCPSPAPFCNAGESPFYGHYLHLEDLICVVRYPARWLVHLETRG
jgi:hypothetical protein